MTDPGQTVIQSLSLRPWYPLGLTQIDQHYHRNITYLLEKEKLKSMEKAGLECWAETLNAPKCWT